MEKPFRKENTYEPSAILRYASLSAQELTETDLVLLEKIKTEKSEIEDLLNLEPEQIILKAKEILVPNGPKSE